VPCWFARRSENWGGKFGGKEERGGVAPRPRSKKKKGGPRICQGLKNEYRREKEAQKEREKEEIGSISARETSPPMLREQNVSERRRKMVASLISSLIGGNCSCPLRM